MQLLPVYKTQIPYEANYRISGRTFTFKFNYNQMADFFTVDLRLGETPVVLGEKLIFGKALFISYGADDRIPFPAIIPIDLSLIASRVGWAELGESVYLYIPSAEQLEAMA